MTERLRLQGRSRGWLFAGCGMLVVSTDSFFVRWSRAEVWDLVFWVALISLVIYFVTGSRSESMNPIRSWRRFPIPLTAIAVLSTVSQISYITAVTPYHGLQRGCHRWCFAGDGCPCWPFFL